MKKSTVDISARLNSHRCGSDLVERVVWDEFQAIFVGLTSSLAIEARRGFS
jgi:hypothetical protein